MDLKIIEDKGVHYYNYICQNRGAGNMAIEEKIITLNGQLRITLTFGSYKFGPEIQFRIISPKCCENYEEKNRNKSDFNTTEIIFSALEIDNLIEVLQEFKSIMVRRGIR